MKRKCRRQQCGNKHYPATVRRTNVQRRTSNVPPNSFQFQGLRPLGFSTKEYDEKSGMSYYGFRYYDPHSARWMNKDPILWEGGINMMRYERNSPLHHIDAYGRSPIVIGGLIALYEIALHKYLYVKAFEVFPDDECCPPRDRERHCWVNCMSVRIHGVVSYGSGTAGLIASIYKEGVDLVKGGDWHDTLEDMQANVYGMQVAYKVWKSCESHCVVCPYKR